MNLGDVTIHSYQEADQYLGDKTSRPLGYATKLEREDTIIGVKHHDTYIIRFYPTGEIVLDTDGWRSRTTKDRLNMFLPSPWRVWQERNVWYLSCGYGDENPYIYFDGIIIKDDKVVNAEEAPDPKQLKKLAKQINKYAKRCADSLPLPLPSGGDCWYCLMQTNDGEMLGDATNNTDHLLSHMEDEYVVPSLVWRALQEAGFHPDRQIIHSLAFGQTDMLSLMDMAEDRVKQAVSKYMKKRFKLPY